MICLCQTEFVSGRNLWAASPKRSNGKLLRNLQLLPHIGCHRIVGDPFLCFKPFLAQNYLEIMNFIYYRSLHRICVWTPPVSCIPKKVNGKLLHNLELLPHIGCHRIIVNPFSVPNPSSPRITKEFRILFIVSFCAIIGFETKLSTFKWWKKLEYLGVPFKPI